jgi:hypothetical protein
MKNRRLVSYFTIVLILFQSFSAIANSLDFHATDPAHLQQIHQHSDNHNAAKMEHGPSKQQVKKLDDAKGTPASHHNPADCHHCGHCNGTHLQWVGQQAFRSTDLAQQSHQFYYLRALINAPINQLLRPPKT